MVGDAAREAGPHADALQLATVEVVGALAYGQLRSFVATARLAGLAPDARTADQVATIAVREHAGYVLLRDHLVEHTELPAAVMDRQKPHLDAYFDRVPLDDWFGATLFFALGLPIAADFSRAIAPALPPDTAEVVTRALADRDDLAAEAVAQLRPVLTDDAARERARHLTADLLGRALTGFQGVMTDTDALKVLLTADVAPGETGEQRVKRLAIDVLEAHRRRAVAFGLEDLDDVS